jgi:hypothetical protein
MRNMNKRRGAGASRDAGASEEPRGSERSEQAPSLVVFTTRLTAGAKDRLLAIAQVRSEAAYTLLEQAFWSWWEDLPADDRQAAEQILAILARRRAGQEAQARASSEEPAAAEPSAEPRRPGARSRQQKVE